MPPPLYRFARAVSWPLVHLLYRLEATGLEHVPKTGGFVLAANHTSNFDPWPLGMSVYPRHLRFMAKSELFKPVLSSILWGLGAFPVRRGLADLEAIETAVQLVRSGEVVMMFPEGTRQRKGLLKKYQARPHTGAARIALKAGAPLIPAAVVGTNRLSRLPRLRVAYGPPVPLADLEADTRESAQVATDRLMAEIERLKEVA